MQGCLWITPSLPPQMVLLVFLIQSHTRAHVRVHDMRNFMERGQIKKMGTLGRLFFILCVVAFLFLLVFFTREFTDGNKTGRKEPLSAVSAEKPEELFLGVRGAFLGFTLAEEGTRGAARFRYFTREEEQLHIKEFVFSSSDTRDTLLRAQEALLLDLYAPQRPPYPEFLTQETACPARFMPKRRTMENGFAYTLFAGSRFTYGVCADDLIEYKAVIAFLACGSARAQKAEYFIPRTDPNADALRAQFLDGIGCTADDELSL